MRTIQFGEHRKILTAEYDGLLNVYFSVFDGSPTVNLFVTTNAKGAVEMELDQLDLLVLLNQPGFVFQNEKMSRTFDETEAKLFKQLIEYTIHYQQRCGMRQDD